MVMEICEGFFSRNLKMGKFSLLSGGVVFLACLSVFSGGVAGAVTPGPAPASTPYVATFSILGYDPATGMVGGAVQSRVTRRSPSWARNCCHNDFASLSLSPGLEKIIRKSAPPQSSS